jgi:hypothetical protein
VALSRHGSLHSGSGRSVQQIKGSVLKSRLAFVVDHSGNEGRERVLQALHEDDRRALNSVLTLKWYPLDLGLRLDGAIVRTLLTTHDAEVFSAPDCLTVVGWYRRALELCGAAEVTVVEEDCRARGADVCRYRLGWA